MQVFTTALLEQTRRFNLSSELIFVEWNPPPDKPPLAEALQWPAQFGPCSVRIITVSPKLHGKFKHSDKLPLFQMIGKNVGIRRARGVFVLATNIDVIFSDELMRFLAKQSLNPDSMYRIDRHDAPSDVPLGSPIREQLEYCRKKVIRVNAREGTFAPESDIKRRLKQHRDRLSVELRESLPTFYKSLATGVLALGNFSKKQSKWWSWIRVWFPYKFAPRTLLSPRAVRSYFFNRFRLLSLVLSKQMTPFRGASVIGPPRNMGWEEYWRKGLAHTPSVIQRQQFGSSPSDRPVPTKLVRSLYDVEGSQPRLQSKHKIPRKLLHTNACGDFTLLSRDRWFDLRGYPEWEMYSFNIDSFTCYAAYYGGAEEVMIQEPCRFYHIEHGAGWTPEQSEQLRKRMEEQGIPWFDWPECVEWIEKMHEDQAAAVVNSDHWGLGNAKLPETLVGDSLQAHIRQSE
jgi:hypothetical protein